MPEHTDIVLSKPQANLNLESLLSLFLLSVAVVNGRNLPWDQNATEILLLKDICSIWFRVSSKLVVYVHNYVVMDGRLKVPEWAGYGYETISILVGMHPVPPCLQFGLKLLSSQT